MDLLLFLLNVFIKGKVKVEIAVAKGKNFMIKDKLKKLGIGIGKSQTLSKNNKWYILILAQSFIKIWIKIDNITIAVIF